MWRYRTESVSDVMLWSWSWHLRPYHANPDLILVSSGLVNITGRRCGLLEKKQRLQRRDWMDYVTVIERGRRLSKAGPGW